MIHNFRQIEGKKTQCSIKKRSRFLRKNQHYFRQINVFAKEFTKELISRNIFERVIHSEEIMEIHCHTSLTFLLKKILKS